MTSAEKVRRWRKKKTDEGGRNLSVLLDPDSARIFESLRSQFGNNADVIKRAIESLEKSLNIQTENPVDQLYDDTTPYKRKDNDAAKRYSPDIYRDMFHNASELLFAHDLAGKLFLTNSVLNEILGYSKSELENRNIRNLLRGRYRDEFDDYLKRVKTKGFDTGKMRIETRAGNTIFIEYKTTLVTGTKGMKYARGICRDLTEHLKVQRALKASEKKLIESEKRYRDIFENINEYIFIHDLNGKFIDTNFHFVTGVKYSKDELINRMARDLLPKKYKADFDKYLKRIVEKGYDKGLLSVLDKDGRQVVVEYSNSVILGIDGPIAVRGVARDVTAEYKARKSLRESEEKLRLAHDELEKRVQLRTRQLSESHEKLEEKTKDLEEANIALRVLLEKKDETQNDVEEKMLSSIKDLILPVLNKMKLTRLTATQKSYADIIESNLDNIISPYSLNLSAKYYKLSPTEIQIANLVREGKTTKEISELLNLAMSTIHTYRDNIRVKLKIKNKKVNLRDHLMALQK